MKFNDAVTGDFVIACENREIHVHKAIIVARSPFLRRFLTADPSCARINANNAKYHAMVIVLHGFYEAPTTGNEFGAYHFDVPVITSIWEIAMHFQIPELATLATARLLQLVDRSTAFRVLQATMKHPTSNNAKALQRHIVSATCLPPQLTADEQAPWQVMLSDHAWLKEAVVDIESTQSQQSQEQRSVSNPSHADRIDEIRETYQRYVRRRSASTDRTAFADTAKVHNSTFGPLAVSTPGRDVGYEAVDVETPTKPDGDLNRSAVKLREDIAKAQDQLADLSVALKQVRQEVDERPRHVRARRSTRRAKIASPLDVSQSSKIMREIAAAKAAYAQEMSEWRKKSELKRSLAEHALAEELEVIGARCRQLGHEEAFLAEELDAAAASYDAVKSEGAGAEKFVADGRQYVEAVNLAFKELESLFAEFPLMGSSRGAMRKALGGLTLDAKESRDRERAATVLANERQTTLREHLAAENQAVSRLQRSLKHVDDVDSMAAESVLGAVL
jgi:hypothetical protein